MTTYDIYFHDSLKTYLLKSSQSVSVNKLDSTLTSNIILASATNKLKMKQLTKNIWFIKSAFFKNKEAFLIEKPNGGFWGDNLIYGKLSKRKPKTDYTQQEINIKDTLDFDDLLLFLNNTDKFDLKNDEETLIYTDSSTIRLNGLILKTNFNLPEYLKTKISKELEIRDCILGEGEFSIQYYDFQKSFEITYSKTPDSFTLIRLRDCKITNFDIRQSQFNILVLDSNKFSRQFSIYGVFPHEGNLLGTEEENLVEIQIRNSDFKLSPSSNYKKGVLPRLFTISANKSVATNIRIIDNILESTLDSSYLNISANIEELYFTENKIDIPVSFNGSTSQTVCNISKNTFYNKGVLITNQFTFPEQSIRTKIPWKDIDKGRLNSIVTSSSSDKQDFSNTQVLYSAKSKRELSNEDNFLEYIKTYNFLYSLYKNLGDKNAANRVFSEMKDAEMHRLRYIYETEGGLKNWFKWWLAWLLKVYTEHGTDPAKALVISFYLMWGFAIFYFFFPSEWDIYSKSSIVQNFKQAISKDDKKVFQPFLKAVFYVLLSFLNALTLSLNAFVTLGFGNIPTKGIARYVCILQGFMGWFLLSIFSVALINQVLG